MGKNNTNTTVKPAKKDIDTVIVGASVTIATKEAAQAVLKGLGFTMAQAVRMFIRQMIAEKRIPFDINYTAEPKE